MNTDPQFDIVWYLGRFQGFHKSHKSNVQQCLNLGKEVLILLGSANTAPTPENPWSPEERQQMIVSSMNDEYSLDGNRLCFDYIDDSYYNWNKWIDSVRRAVNDFAWTAYGKPASDLKIGFVGPAKNAETDKVIKIFENDYEYIPLAIDESVSASDIRAAYFSLEKDALPCGYPRGIDEPVRKWMWNWTQTPEYERLKAEYKFKKWYLKDRKGNARYDINDCATDALVTTESGHVLLMKRGGEIGNGQWAIPGGHLNLDETFYEGAIRELREEVNLRVPVAVLEGSLEEAKLFDYPLRETHTRMVTVAHHFKLKDLSPPKARPGKDEAGHQEALEVKWFTRTELRNMRRQIFSDHAQIIEYFLGS